MAISFSDEQRAAIGARGHVLVSAAAGSGKTAVLTQRVFERVFDAADPIDIDRMLILTFTNDAAAEMRGRISKKFAEYLMSNPENARAARQGVLVDSADISTIDSFCINLIRENFEVLGISPDFKIIGNEHSDMLKKRAMDEVLDAAYGSNDGVFKNLLELIGDSEYTISGYIDKIHTYVRSLPSPQRWLDNVVQMYRTDADFEQNEWCKYALARSRKIIAAAISRLEARSDCLGFENDDNTADSNFYYDMQRLLHGLRAAADQSWDDLYYKLQQYSNFDLGNKGKKRNNAVIDAVKEAEHAIGRLPRLICGSADDCIKDIERVRPHLEKLFELVRQYSDAYQSLKGEQNLLDFSDAEYLALELLADVSGDEVRLTDAAADICARYDEVMIDEYQDTNDLQDMLVYVLSDKAKHLFLVGDVKQSIYRFRKANPENFLKKKNTFAPYEEGMTEGKVCLGGNYRSRAGVCDFVNGIFARIMSEDAGGMVYGEEDRLVPKGTFADNNSHAAEVDIITDSDLTQEEYISSLIRRLVDEKFQVSEGSGLRDIRFGDIAVLMRSPGKRYGAFAAQFAADGIPFSASMRGGLFEQPEVMLLLNILRAADNPRRDLPLLGAMMSPVFCFDAERVARIKLQGQKGLYANLLLAARDDKTAAEFVDTLGRIRQLCATLSAGEATRHTVNLLGINTVIAGFGGGDARREDLLKFIGLAAQFDAGQIGGMSAFLRYIDSVIDSGSDPDRSAVSGENAVKITSIHASKGLQYKVVILADAEKGFNMMDVNSSIVLGAHYGVGLRVFNEAGVRYDTLCRAVIADEEGRETCAEAMRLLYVALTRAVDRVYVVGSSSNFTKPNGLLNQLKQQVEICTDATGVLSPDCVLSSPNYLNWVVESLLCNCPDVFDGGCKGCVVKLIDEVEQPDEQANGADKPDCDLDIATPLAFNYPHGGAVNINTKYSASQLNSMLEGDDNCCTARPAFLSSKGLTPAERGTATHKFMQFADSRAAAVDVGAEVDRLVAGGYLTEQEGEAIDREAVEGFYRSELYSRISAAEQVMREIKFIYELPAEQVSADFAGVTEPVVVQGVTDCVFIENGTAYIVDFKTDRVKAPAELSERYRRQMQVYAAALAKTLGVPVGDCILYSFCLGSAVRVQL